MIRLTIVSISIFSSLFIGFSIYNLTRESVTTKTTNQFGLTLEFTKDSEGRYHGPQRVWKGGKMIGEKWYYHGEPK